MNKYIFPGADASCSLGWVINQLEAAGFEIKNVDVLGVHYSATIFRWYKNWISNKDKVVEKYGDRFVLRPSFQINEFTHLPDRWFRIWVFFLAYSTIISRCVRICFYQNQLFTRDSFHLMTAKVALLSSRSLCTKISMPIIASTAFPIMRPSMSRQKTHRRM